MVDILKLTTYYSIISMVKLNANSVCCYIDEFLQKSLMAVWTFLSHAFLDFILN